MHRYWRDRGVAGVLGVWDSEARAERAGVAFVQRVSVGRLHYAQEALAQLTYSRTSLAQLITWDRSDTLA